MSEEVVDNDVVIGTLAIFKVLDEDGVTLAYRIDDDINPYEALGYLSVIAAVIRTELAEALTDAPDDEDDDDD